MRRYVALSLLTCFVFSGSTFAKYDKTEWGMTLKKVKSLYPGGSAQRQQNGHTIYSVVRPVGGLSTALVSFI